MKKILIVEDDTALNNGIVLCLKQNDLDFTQAFCINDAKKYYKDKNFDLIILDINLPDGNGLDLCKFIRKESNTPIIFLTANDMETDVVTGFELGADDYITKPFSLMILRARVLSLLKRCSNTTTNDNSTFLYKSSKYIFDFDKMNFSKGNDKIVLSTTEQKLLKILVNNKGNTLRRSTLVDKIWTDEAEFVDENALSVTINRLRNKLEDTPKKPKHIKTVYGLGYTWVDEENE